MRRVFNITLTSLWLEIFYIITRDKLLERKIDKKLMWTKGNLQLIRATPEEVASRNQQSETVNLELRKKADPDSQNLAEKINLDAQKIDTQVRKAMEQLKPSK